MSIFDNEYMRVHDFFFFLVHPVTAFKRGPHGRLVFAKCVLPSVNKVYYYLLLLLWKSLLLFIIIIMENGGY